MDWGEKITDAAVGYAVVSVLGAILTLVGVARKWLFGQIKEDNTQVVPTPAARATLAVLTALGSAFLATGILWLSMSRLAPGLPGPPGPPGPSGTFHGSFDFVKFGQAGSSEGGKDEGGRFDAGSTPSARRIASVKLFPICAITEIDIGTLITSKNCTLEPMEGEWTIKVTGNFSCKVTCLKLVSQ